MSEHRASEPASQFVVYAALAGNLAIAITKFVAAGITGSSAMLSEGVHSLVDTGNEILLLYGMHRARRPPDALHPLGHARELYFWSFIVAVLVFAVGAGVSFYEGIVHLRSPEPVRDARAAYIVLCLSAVFEGFSWRIALKEFRRAKGGRSYWRAARESKDPSTFTVLFEDSAALLGIAIALAGVTLSELLDIPAFDGIASIGIGILLGLTALFLARESKNLLVGEAAQPGVERALREAAAAEPAIRAVNGVLTSQLGPRQVIGALSAEFDRTLSAPQIESSIERIEARLRERYPEVRMLFVRPQTAAGWRAGHAARVHGTRR